MVCFNTRKHSNEAIYYNVGFLEDAIQQQKKVIFYYFDLNEHGEKVYRRDGHHYVVEPIGLVFNEDNYYLICYSSRHDKTSIYRVDRMESVEVIDDAICQKAIDMRDSVSDYTEQAFKMFSGQLEDVVLEFDRGIIGAVYDKFGENTKMLPSGERKCIATVKVRISPTFWGWIFQFGKQMKVLSPSSVVEAYEQQIAALLEK
jgi:predicted DNA-binding transcriptional regulator YafY